jgi:hypothetical protein
MDTSSPPDIPVLDYEPIEPGKDPSSRKRRGLYGCLFALVVVCALIGGCAYYAYNKALDIVLEDTPSAWPSLDLTTAEVDAAEQKLEQVIKISEEGGPPGSFTFDDRELNALFARFDRFKDRVFVSLTEDELQVEFSVPYHKRFLNGRLQGTIKAEQGTVHVSLRSAQVGTYVFSPEILQQTAVFLKEEINKSPEVQEALKTFHVVKIKGGLILVELNSRKLKDEDAPTSGAV